MSLKYQEYPQSRKALNAPKPLATFTNDRPNPRLIYTCDITLHPEPEPEPDTTGAADEEQAEAQELELNQ